MKSDNKVYFKLQETFLSLDQEFFKLPDKDVLNSKEFKSISQIYPRWEKIIKKGFNRNKLEASRTIKHIFQTLHVYFLIMNDQYKSNVHKNNLNLVKSQLTEIYQFNPLLFPLILLLHDIGRPFNRIWHPLKSKKLILKYSLLERFHVGDLDQHIILSVIEQHLLIGTIFTGEASYLGSISLWKSLENFGNHLSEEVIDVMFECLRAFTVIDIWGYDYSTIYDHYFDYYFQICSILAEKFKETYHMKKHLRMMFLKEKLSQIDRDNLKWRIACSLRIFQHINTSEYLTKDFYYSKIEEGLKNLNLNWERFISKMGKNHPKIQFKYVLSVMMLLASGKFKRKPIDKLSIIEPNIFHFWIRCCRKLDDFIMRNYQQKTPLFYYVFDLPRIWFLDEKYVGIVKNTNFIDKISEQSFNFDNYIQGYLLNISI